jgi:hypothetical protein
MKRKQYHCDYQDGCGLRQNGNCDLAEPKRDCVKGYAQEKQMRNDHLVINVSIMALVGTLIICAALVLCQCD